MNNDWNEFELKRAFLNQGESLSPHYSLFVIHYSFIFYFTRNPENFNPPKKFYFFRNFQVFSLRFRENRLQYLLMSLKY